MTTPRIYGFVNSFTQGCSGGDMVFAEVLKRVTDYNVVITTSKLGKQFCEDVGVRAQFMTTTAENSFSNVILTYFKRIVLTLGLPLNPKAGDVLYAGSDFLTETIPVAFHKHRHPQTIWLQHLFHLIPQDRLIPYLSQRLSLVLIRWGADAIVVDNSLLREHLIKMGLKADKIHV